MAQLECGKVQIYTGDGKGKTTAALGLSLRARGLGLDVLFLQFAKKLVCAEHEIAPQIGLEIAQATRETPELCAQQILNLAHWALAPAGDAPDASIPIAARNKPVDVLVLDEPTAMLDPQGRQEVVSIVEKLSREQNITVVLITHHMDEATHAGRVVAMNDGKIVADGTPAEVFSQVELLRSVGLSVPETTELLYALRADGFDLPLDALSIDQCAQALYDRIKA